MGRVAARALVVLLVVAATLSADAMPGEHPVRLPIELGTKTTAVVVVAGDHLWKISADRLAEDLGRAATDVEIWPYWWEVIASNLPALRSGDPDLIYPGELIQLPATGSP